MVADLPITHNMRAEGRRSEEEVVSLCGGTLDRESPQLGLGGENGDPEKFFFYLGIGRSWDRAAEAGDGL
jgi:hypothetical protein